jgi:hypothetical protein
MLAAYKTFVFITQYIMDIFQDCDIDLFSFFL